MSVRVGDIVLYWEGSTEHAAIVTRVHNPGCVNLFVFDDTSGAYIGERAAKRAVDEIGFGGDKLRGGWSAR